MTWKREELESLIKGDINVDLAKRMRQAPKDPERFEQVIALLQDKLEIKERILLPLAEHLFIVEKDDGSRVVKCDCGFEFGDYRVNWKLNALINVMSTEELEAIYPGYRRPDTTFCEIREFFCPGCSVLLEVEAVTPGYPIVFEFLPDLDTFYEDWLNQPLQHKQESKDLSYELIESWQNGG